MQNNMVSIPAANMNGGLKAANGSGTVVGVGVGVGVAGTVLTNAQRVYLTPASSYHLAARQTTVSGAATAGVGVVATAKAGNNNNNINNNSSSSNNNNSNSNNTNAAASTSTAGTVRYFSQFSKLQPVQQLNTSVGQRKLLNGDTMLLVNGSKPLIFATPNHNNNKLIAAAAAATTTAATTTTAAATAATATTTATTTVPNGNRLLINKQQLQQQKQPQQQQQQQQEQQPATVIDELQHEELQIGNEIGDIIEIKQELEEPLALLTSSAPNSIRSADQDAEPELDIVINNVVCSFSVRCHLKLREIALNGSNVEYRRENGMVTMKLRRPYTTASIWSSGRITCTGATSESQAKIAARRYARCLSKLGFPTHFQNFRIVNVLGTCSMPWAIKIVNFSERHRDNASYEPELHPGVTYKMREPKATLKIFSTGSITVTAASVNDVESAIQHIYPLVHEFRKQRSAEELQHLRQKQRAQGGDDLNELDDQLALLEGKSAVKDDDIFLNTTAAHTNASRPQGAGAANSLPTASLYTARRIEQYKSYQDMQEQTQMERRHVSYASDAAKGSNNSSSSTGDNICANARRRATECWATKLQNKRPRYNDPGSTATVTAGAIARTATTAVASYNTSYSAVGVAATATATATASAANKLRNNKPPLIPVDVVLKQSSSRARNAAAGVSASAYDDGGVYTKRETFSPTDFQVDDLIEEDEDDLDMHF